MEKPRNGTVVPGRADHCLPPGMQDVQPQVASQNDTNAMTGAEVGGACIGFQQSPTFVMGPTAALDRHRASTFPAAAAEAQNNDDPTHSQSVPCGVRFVLMP